MLFTRIFVIQKFFYFFVLTMIIYAFWPCINVHDHIVNCFPKLIVFSTN